MIMLGWFLLSMIILAVIQSGKLIYQKHWGELAAFAALWVGATGYASMIILGVPLPTPLEVIDFVLTWFYDFTGVNFPSP